MKTQFYLAIIALLIGFTGCSRLTPEPDYSGIQNLTYTISKSSVTTVEASRVFVYPNPFVNQVKVELYSSIPANAVVYVSDEKGKYRKEIATKVQGSINVDVNFTGMPQGIYLCEVELAGKTRFFRLIHAK